MFLKKLSEKMGGGGGGSVPGALPLPTPLVLHSRSLLLLLSIESFALIVLTKQKIRKKKDRVMSNNDIGKPKSMHILQQY